MVSVRASETQLAQVLARDLTTMADGLNDTYTLLPNRIPAE
jgi:hypothetical protein